MRSYFTMWRRFFDFNSRSRRSEFWIALFWSIFVLAIVAVFDFLYVKKPLFIIFAAVIHVVPMLALLFRRMHDTGHSGIWPFLMVVPGIMLVCAVYVFYNYNVSVYLNFQETIAVVIGLFALSVGAALITLAFLFADSNENVNKWGTSPKYDVIYDDDDEEDDDED